MLTSLVVESAGLKSRDVRRRDVQLLTRRDHFEASAIFLQPTTYRSSRSNERNLLPTIAELQLCELPALLFKALIVENSRIREFIMLILSFTLSPESLGKLHDALVCLGKFSEAVCIEAANDKVLSCCPLRGSMSNSRSSSF